MIKLDPLALGARQTEDIVPGLRNKTGRQRLKLNTTTFAPVSFFLTWLLLDVFFHYLSKGRQKEKEKNKRKKKEIRE